MIGVDVQSHVMGGHKQGLAPVLLPPMVVWSVMEQTDKYKLATMTPAMVKFIFIFIL